MDSRGNSGKGKRRKADFKMWTAALPIAALVALSGCGGTPAPTATIAAPTAAAPTTAASQPTADTSVAASPTAAAAGQPTAGDASATASAVAYTRYTDPDGNWAMDYPSDWSATTVTATHSTQLVSPSGDAIVIVNYRDAGAVLDPQSMADTFVKGMQKALPTNFKETGRAPQSDGSIRIDLSTEIQNQPLEGHAFVEQRGTVVYALALFNNTDKGAQYKDILQHMVTSYTLPPKSGGKPADSTPADATAVPTP